MSNIDLSNLQNSTQTLGQSQNLPRNDQDDFNKMYILRVDHELIVADKVQMLRQQIETLQQQQIKFEERLELKDNDLLQLGAINSTLQGEIGKLQGVNGRLQGELSGLNVVKSLLKEKEDEIKKLNAELIQVSKGSPVNPHKQCEALESQLRQQLQESEELSQATFNKLNLRIEDLKNRLMKAEGKEVEGPESEIGQAQNKFGNTSEESDEDTIPEIGINCKLNSNNLNDRIQAQQQPKMKQQLDDTSSDISMIDTTKRSYSKQEVSQMQTTSGIAVVTHKSEGHMQRNDAGELVDVTASVQQNNLAKIQMATYRYRCFTCEKLFSCVAGWREHQEWMAVNGRTCKCDVFQHGKYYHTIGIHAPYKRTIEKKELKKLETLIEATMQNPELIRPEIRKTELETKRDIQRDDSLEFIKTCRNQLAEIEGWLLLLSQQCKKTELKALDDPICDAIIYPRCFLIFGKDTKEHDRQLKIFLIDHGIPVRLVTNVATNNTSTAFIYLMDSDNKFSPELVDKLGESLEDLGNQVRAKVPPSELQQQRIEAELKNLYIRQMDYTKDFLGFFMVLSLLYHKPEHRFDILRELGRIIGMTFSENHSQLVTSIQFESFIADLVSGKLVRSERLKIYNKLVHLLTIASIKAKLSMGTGKLFKAPLAFHQKKILPSFKDGLTRIELSSYFNSVKEWKEKALNVGAWERRIASVQDALRDASEQLIYKVNFKVFWDSFWLTVDNATAVIVLAPDLWTLAYAYSKRSYLFTGHCTDKHNKSGAKLTFLQRFAGKRTLVRASNGKETKEFLIHRHGQSRQIPIESLNVIQHEEYRFPIDLNKWFYNLSKEQLDQIYFTCDNQEEFDKWFGQDPALTRSDMSEFEKHTDQSMSDAEEYMPQSNVFQKEYDEVIDTSSQQIHERKREEKKRSRSRNQDLQDIQNSSRQRNQIEQKQGGNINFSRNGSNKNGTIKWKCKVCTGSTIDTASHNCREIQHRDKKKRTGND